jgi:transcriptional regulator with XRE-family HTH domain
MDASTIIKATLQDRKISYSKFAQMLGRAKATVMRQLQIGNLRESQIAKYGEALQIDLFYLLSPQAKAEREEFAKRETSLMKEAVELEAEVGALKREVAELHVRLEERRK